MTAAVPVPVPAPAPAPARRRPSAWAVGLALVAAAVAAAAYAAGGALDGAPAELVTAEDAARAAAPEALRPAAPSRPAPGAAAVRVAGAPPRVRWVAGPAAEQLAGEMRRRLSRCRSNARLLRVAASSPGPGSRAPAPAPASSPTPPPRAADAEAQDVLLLVQSTNATTLAHARLPPGLAARDVAQARFLRRVARLAADALEGAAAAPGAALAIRFSFQSGRVLVALEPDAPGAPAFPPLPLPPTSGRAYFAGPAPSEGWDLVADRAADVRRFDACDELAQPTPPTTPRSARPVRDADPVLRVPRCPPGSLPGSALSCSELGWNQTVSGVSRVSNGGLTCAASAVAPLVAAKRARSVGLSVALAKRCAGATAFPQADAFCRSAGARLCTHRELAALQATVDTGCAHDKHRVWSLTRCGALEAGHVTAPGKPQAYFRAECTLAGEVARGQVQAYARCCADRVAGACLSPRDVVSDVVKPFDEDAVCGGDAADGQVAGSRRACAELDFSFQGVVPADSAAAPKDKAPGAPGPAQVRSGSKPAAGFCLRNTFRFEGEHHARCRWPMPYRAAAELCSRMGARLCEARELQALKRGGARVAQACSSSLAKSGKPAAGYWSSTSCGGGKLMLDGLPKSPPQCTYPDAEAVALVACCGDVSGPRCQVSGVGGSA